MRKILILGLLASILFAISDKDLRKLAEEAGLKPLPTNIKEIDSALTEIGIKPNETSKEKEELGKMLYFEPRLSKSGIISCNTCHNLALGGVDGVPASTGHKWTANPHHINAPTVYNSVLNSIQFWDGRSDTLANQAKGPMVAEPEMASSPELITQRLSSIPEYVEIFSKIYQDGITFDNVADALAAFEKTLITPSKFDEFLRGDSSAMTKEEKRGFELFLDKGCASCHNGMILGGTMQAFQVASKYKFANIGDFKGDKNGMVRTPTLRNILLTAPYFHNGVIWDIEDAVKEMGSIQLGIKISDGEAKAIVEFLKTLTGKMPQLVYPTLPPSTKQTPKPQLD